MQLWRIFFAKHTPDPTAKKRLWRGWILVTWRLSPRLFTPRISLFCRFSAGWPGLQACTKRIKLSSNLKDKQPTQKSNGQFLYQFLWVFFGGGGIFQRFGWRLLSNIEIHDCFCLFIEKTRTKKKVSMGKNKLSSNVILQLDKTFGLGSPFPSFFLRSEWLPLFGWTIRQT